MNSISYESIVREMQSIEKSIGDIQINGELDEAKAGSFSDVLRNAIDTVNETQQASRSMATAFERGDPNVDLTAVMVAAEKASISFQAVVEVRNQVLRAYRDVMSMPV